MSQTGFCRHPAICRTVAFEERDENMAAETSTSDRLEARITPAQKSLFKRAATLRGVTLTDFVVSAVHDAAIKTLETTHVIVLGREDQEAFAEALRRPAPPNRRLRQAARKHWAKRAAR